MIVQSIPHFVLQECNRIGTLDNNCDAWITRHMHVRGFMMVGLTLLDAIATTLAMA